MELYREHWAYEFLDRLQTKGMVSPLLLSVRPWFRDDLAIVVADLRKRLQAHPEQFTQTEREILDQLTADFAAELRATGIALPQRYREPHLLTVTDSSLSVTLDALLFQTVVSRRGTAFRPAELKTTLTPGGIIRGTLGRGLWFYVDVRNSAIRGGEVPEKERWDPSLGLPILTSGKTVYTDQATAYFSGHLPWFRVQIGRGALWWGPSDRAALTLSSHIPLFDFLRGEATWKRLRFTYFHAELRSSFGRKYLVGHRIDWLARTNLLVGATETLVYGKRRIELAYLNPIMPYHVAEHHLGDKDNNNISLDFWWRVRPGLAAYGEFLIDDMTLSAPLLRYWGNKFAFTLGGRWLDPGGLRDSELRIEYTRIEPYVYTHYDSINRYEHYDQIIGNALGPNADEWYAEWNRYFGRDFQLRLWLSRARKGEGSVRRAHTREDPETKSFLSGIVETSRRMGIEARDQIRRDIFVSLRYEQVWKKNAERVAGRHLHGRAFFVSLAVNY